MIRLGAPHRDPRTAALLVGAVACAIYANSLANGFAYDDVPILSGNPGLHSLRSIVGYLRGPYWPGRFGRDLGLWRPVTSGMLGLQWVVGGGSPVVFHAVNVLLHAAASVLTFFLCLELISLPAALVAGLVFALHPVHVEAVSNVVGFAEVFSTAALVAACLVHVRGPTTTTWGWALAVAGLYGLGFGAKESAATLPGLIFLLDAAKGHIGFRELGPYLRDRWRVYLAMAVVAAGLLFGRHQVLGTIASPLGPWGSNLLNEIPKIWTLAEVWTHYVRLWVFPLDLSADYSPQVIPNSIGWHAVNVLGVLLALAILTTAWVAWRKPELVRGGNGSARVAAFGVVWFVIAMSPVSNTIFLSGVLLAERTFYLPSVGLAAATGWLVVRVAKVRPRVAWAGLAVALTASGVRTWTRNPTWDSTNTVLNTLLRDYPQSGRAQWILGDSHLAIGDTTKAMLAYRLAINVWNSDYALLSQVAGKLINMGRLDAAEGLLQIAWKDRPQFALAPGLLAQIYAERQDFDRTERFSRLALARWDGDLIQRHLLMWSLAAQGKWTEARQERREIEERAHLRIWPEWMYLAYDRREIGDTVGMRAAADSARASIHTLTGQRTLDSLVVAEFGLPSRFAPPDPPL